MPTSGPNLLVLLDLLRRCAGLQLLGEQRESLERFAVEHSAVQLAAEPVVRLLVAAVPPVVTTLIKATYSNVQLV
jgi:hypothetical protein